MVFLGKIKIWTEEDLGWSCYSILKHQPFISEIAPCERSSYFSLPKELSNSIKKTHQYPQQL